jgi:hypothetical protein
MSMVHFQRLPVQFSKNGLPYRLVLRNEVVAMFGVGGIYYPDNFHYEVVKIYRVPERVLFGKLRPACEALPSNEQFGLDGSKCFVDRERAKAYFLELTTRLKSRLRASEDLSLKKNSNSVVVNPTQQPTPMRRTIFYNTSGPAV